MSCEIFYILPGGQVTFCVTKRHLAVAKATEILIIKLGFSAYKKLGGGAAIGRVLSTCWPIFQKGPAVRKRNCFLYFPLSLLF